MGVSGPGHVSVAQVRVPDSAGLAKGPQRGVQSFVVIKPHDQQQVQVEHLYTSLQHRTAYRSQELYPVSHVIAVYL